ncbi:hypothetical protein BU25DRAFT_456355 [Macroventuria anomochaeta]|uniref:Uncharacterized protein n=1 Tax=Macroventuria anomochaeta TaxID=301207 RepID=A0ACB6S9A6_9PLEO|nr:uncharacterized protein BU25DRAFT_456355 [Macroventuria anomochaeta]KAF2629933.1 hypothetical protein BU25DRAFT_456355 [Macroventuria anomochaeta]
MKFTTVIAAVLSMATFAIAVPVAVPAPAKDVEVRQNHGKCVKSSGGGVMEDVNC